MMQTLNPISTIASASNLPANSDRAIDFKLLSISFRCLLRVSGQLRHHGHQSSSVRKQDTTLSDTVAKKLRYVRHIENVR
eukprot:scaffold168814_cov22-Prasinocladus_malaysianus.AAC.1